MSILWRDEMAVDHGTIDEDHGVLIAIINEFSEASVDPDRLGDILIELAQYTEAHFAREERLQMAAQYPFCDAHHHEHLRLIKRLDELREKFESAVSDSGAVRGVQAEIGGLLRDWLVNHIIGSDRRLRPYVGAMASHVGAVAPGLKRKSAGR